MGAVVASMSVSCHVGNEAGTVYCEPSNEDSEGQGQRETEERSGGR